MMIKKGIIASSFVALSLNAIAAPNPASQDWVSANFKPQLTAAVWNAACDSGSATSASGCLGNAASPAFTTLSRVLGGFTSYANINPANAPTNSVFIKAFFAGTNTPVNGTTISVTLTGSTVAKCGLFAQSGAPTAYPQGITNEIGNSSTGGPQGVQIYPITSTGSTVTYLQSATPAVTINQPYYLLCVGVNGTDGSSASVLSNITAV